MSKDCTTRQAILEAALALMSEKGFTNTSMDDILNSSGVKKGSLYHFFASKTELGLAVLDLYWERATIWLDDQLASLPGGPLERIQRFFAGEGFPETTGKFTGCLLGTIVAEMSLIDDRLSGRALELLNRFVDRIAEELDKAVRAGEMSAGTDTKSLARQLVTYFEGGLLIAKACQNSQALRDLAPGISALIQSGRNGTCGPRPGDGATTFAYENVRET
ncbi:MAG: putative transcriptional regulator, TetR family protein [Fimbriimonadales bacterium]